MPADTSGRIDKYSAPVQKVFENVTSGAVILNLSNGTQNNGTPGLPSGIILQGDATGGNFVWTDVNATTHTWAVPANAIIQFPFSVVTIEIATSDNVSILAYWHKQTP